MDKLQIIKDTAKMVKEKLEGEGSGHDWWHIYRVWKLAKRIAKDENADLFVVELSALLHDIADYKFHDGDEKIGGKTTEKWLKNLKVDEQVIGKVVYIVDNISFKGGTGTKIKSVEGQIVQDADRLDGIGAIGIARCFAYGGHKGHEIYNPEIKPKLNMTKEQYKAHKGTQINHFYEKLLQLKDLMNTRAGKSVAKERHKFMEIYLKQFFNEWEGNK